MEEDNNRENTDYVYIGPKRDELVQITVTTVTVRREHKSNRRKIKYIP